MFTEYVGCYEEKFNPRALDLAAYSNEVQDGWMTLKTCFDFCTSKQPGGFSYLTMQVGQQQLAEF